MKQTYTLRFISALLLLISLESIGVGDKKETCMGIPVLLRLLNANNNNQGGGGRESNKQPPSYSQFMEEKNKKADNAQYSLEYSLDGWEKCKNDNGTRV